MPIIFPTEPAKVNIHLLPKNAEMICYEVSDVLTISAWMPNSFETIIQNDTMSNDEFHSNYCDGCHRNCHSFLQQYYDEETEETDWDHSDLEDHCNVYDEGYHGQYCPEGNTKQDEEVEFQVSNMVFEIDLNHIGNPPRFNYIKDSAYLQAGYVDNGDVVASTIYMASNVFGTEDYPEGICWGYNEKPNNLRETVSYYFSTPFNNDLVSIYQFKENCNSIKYELNSYRREYWSVQENIHYLCDGDDADALMILDAETNIQAFFTMLMAGFKPLEKASHVIMIPILEDTVEKDGNVYRGYTTIPDDLGRKWFISPTSTDDGLLVGQL
jgi:hypothetical protein